MTHPKNGVPRSEGGQSNGRCVIGLGASAGGIEALRAFFESVPPASGAAYVVILHLSPDHDSQLAQVLQTSTSMPVVQVTARVPIEPDHVYVIPPNKLLMIEQQSLALAEITRVEQRRAPVDLFFRSLADARGSRAVCVILSGTGPNGSSGLRHVKEYGGLVVAQEPDEAQHGDMPRNAIATGMVDLVLPVREIPARIHAYLERRRTDEDERVEPELALPDQQAIREILTVLRVRTGNDFSSYKPGTIQRRIERRLHVRNLPDLATYARTVRENPDEALALMKELLISVTTFFRDPAAWEVLATRIIPRIFVNRSPRDQIRVWVPACATGEEAYSVAMLLAEHASTLPEPPSVQVFATDLDEAAIATAREGVYTEAELTDVSEDRLKGFFTREVKGHRIRSDVRETVLFASQNVIKDPPFSRLDLICCRNLLIYLSRSIQERVIEICHFALRPGGYLFLGGSESPDGSQDLFAVADKAAHIYESRPVTSRITLASDATVTVPIRPALRPPDIPTDERVSRAELHMQLLERYAPPSVVVTDEYNVVHMSEHAGRYLQVSGGEPTRDLLRLVRPELRPDLRTVLHQALRERRSVEVRDVSVVLEGGPRFVDIMVHPVLREAEPARGYLLVTFDERAPRDEHEPPLRATQFARPADTAVSELEKEIAKLKVQLRRTVEQYEAQADDAKSSNEELQAVNEELRSSAEELETSKEELQSVNEELTTVNQELKVKIEELGLTNNDFQNLINSSDVGTIFLDRALRVKLATPAANLIFNLLRTDLGRPLSDITSNLLYDDLHVEVKQVLADLQTLEREVQTKDNRWVSTRLRPYRTTDDRIDGVVITFQDVTERRRAQDQQRQGEERLRLLIDGAIEYAIFTMTSAGIIDYWNSGAERIFGYRADQVIGQHLEVLFTAEDRAAGIPLRELLAVQAKGRSDDERFHVRRDAERFYARGSTIRLGEGLGFAKIVRDMSSQQQAAEALRVLQAEYEARASVKTHELEAEMQARTAAHRHVSMLLHRIVTAQEDERRRIALDLHDQVGQQLVALRLALERLRERAPRDDIDKTLDITGQIDRALSFLSWELRPAILDDLGLAAALPVFVREWSDQYRHPRRVPRDVWRRPAGTRCRGRLLSHRAGSAEQRRQTRARQPRRRAPRGPRRFHRHGRGRRRARVRRCRPDRGRQRGRDPRDAGTRDLDRRHLRHRIWTGQRHVRLRADSGIRRRRDGPPMTHSEKIRVLVADDHETVRQALCVLLRGHDDIEVVADVADGRAAVAKAKELKPAVAIMDVSMPDTNGLSATRAIKADVPEVAIVALSRHADDAYVQELLSAGASGYVLKQSSAEELLKAVREVAAGRRYLDTTLVARTAKAYLSRVLDHRNITPAGYRTGSERAAADGHRLQQQGDRLHTEHLGEDRRSAQGERDAEAGPARPNRCGAVRGAERLAAGSLKK